MTRFVLDTDIVSLLQQGNPAVARHVALHPPEEVATTIITIEEQLSSWYTLLRRAKTAKAMVPVYQRMSDTVQFLAGLPILSFTDTAADLYQGLRKQNPRTGRMDLLIAAIALAHRAILVTRNVSDFDGIANLKVEDWSRQ
jgi:tRNA(fMet)-specific endonuclease VapC